MMKIFSVFDNKAGAYLTPFFCPNRAVALRSFMAAAQDPSHDFSRFANDFVLYEIGEFAEDSGKIIPLAEFENLGSAAQYVNMENGR